MKYLLIVLMTGFTQLQAAFLINVEFYDTTDTYSDANGDTQNYQDISGYESYFQAAADYWNNIIVDYNSIDSWDDEAPTGFTLYAGIGNVDGVDGILAGAGVEAVTYGYLTSGQPYTYATAGYSTVDSTDLSSMIADGSLQSTINHELAHALGFGTLWEYNYDLWTGDELYVEGSGEYIGINALYAYQQAGNLEATYIPVELGGGSGTADGHWDESIFGAELMTGYANLDEYLDEITIQSFADLGYIVNSSIVPEPTSLLLLILGGVTFALQRRRKS